MKNKLQIYAMLLQKEVAQLGPGFFPNSFLRSKFGTKHGTVVAARTMGNIKTGELPEDLEFVGNRSQARFRIRNPFKAIPDKTKAKYHANRLLVKRGTWFNKILDALGLLMKFLNFKK